MILPSPYHAPGFYDDALAKGRHRDIVGGRWEETPRIVLPLLTQHGLTATDHLLDIGAGALRLGRHLAPQVTGYWATDRSRALMLKGWETELDDATRAKLPQDHMIEDTTFTFPPPSPLLLPSPSSPTCPLTTSRPPSQTSAPASPPCDV